jgi:hypothetical protein
VPVSNAWLGRFVVVASILAFLPMCAADNAQRGPQAPPPPASDYATPPPAPPGTMSAPGPSGTSEQHLAPPPGSPGAMREVERAMARADLERARIELEASANDCAQACKALASMERATAHLCALADQSDDQRRCDDATRRLREARDRVKSSCGSCPGGPSVDPGAPVPAFP